MTNDLKTLAEKVIATHGQTFLSPRDNILVAEYRKAANPTAILALLAELEALRVDAGRIEYKFSDGLPSPEVLEKIARNEWDHVQQFFKVFDALTRGEWTWTANSRCKYVELRIDMRDGGCIIKDREGVRISAEQLAYQYRAALASAAKGEK